MEAATIFALHAAGMRRRLAAVEDQMRRRRLASAEYSHEKRGHGEVFPDAYEVGIGGYDSIKAGYARNHILYR